MKAILIGASPFGSKALYDLEIPYILIVDQEDINRLYGQPEMIINFPYKSRPEQIIDVLDFIKSHIDICLSFTEDGLYPCSLLSDSLQITNIDKDLIVNTMDKIKMREILKNNEALGTVQFGYNNIENELFDFPVIVKPIDGSGSQGISFHKKGEAVSVEEGYMWEEYISGQEYSVEMVSQDGKHHLLGITEKVTTGSPNFVELGHITPCELTISQKRRIEFAVSSVLNGLGITIGPTHTEIKLNESGIFIIETHTRPGGDYIPFITELTTGEDQYRIGITALIENNIEKPKSATSYAAIKYFNWPSGKISRITGLDRLYKKNWVEKIVLSNITESRPLKSSLDRNGYVIITGSTYNDIKDKFKFIEEIVEVKYKE